MIIEIEDYDGIISLVNAATYQPFVDENWELEQLKSHFIHQMKLNTILVWQTNNHGGGSWKVNCLTEESNEAAHSEFTAFIEVTDGKLYLADYTDLTMAAQFSTDTIPAEGHADQVYEIVNGSYQVKVKRLFHPEEEVKENNIAFELVFTRTDQVNTNPVDQLFWYTYSL